MTFRLLVPFALSLLLAACSSPATPESPTQESAAPAEATAPQESEEAAAPAPAAEETPPTEAAEAAPAGMGHDHAPAIDVPESEIVAQPGATLGDAVRCPVSKEPFRVTETSTTIDHEGSAIYFCCGSCIRQFRRDPESFLSQADEQP